jgi:hypothetical protein
VTERTISPKTGQLAALAAFGALAALGSWYVERYFFQLSGLTLYGGADGSPAALFAMLLFAAPLEEGAKLALVWGTRRWVGVRRGADGLFAALAVTAGFAAVEATLLLWSPPFDLPVARTAFAVLGQLFFASLWGVVLGTRSRLHLLGATWFIAMLAHGLFDHIVLGRGQGTLGLVLPLVLAMVLLGGLALRDLYRGTRAGAESPRLVAPSLRELAAAIRRRERPPAVRWILAATFVTVGLILSLLVLAVLLGNRLGIDFVAAHEADVTSNGPLLLLAVAVISGFPLAGFLVARASAASSVLEAALGALFAIVLVVAMLSLTAPLAVVFALAVAPLAFGLACIGAWFGLER